MLIQLRMGHIPLRKHLHRIGKANSPMCQTCSSQRETVHHFLMTFPAYTEARRQIEMSIGRAAKLMEILLTNPKVFPHLFQFISATHQFNHVGTNLNLPVQQELPADQAIHLAPVKNRFSDPTKEQEGQDQQGKDVTNYCQGKALREGCHEREWAQMISCINLARNNVQLPTPLLSPYLNTDTLFVHGFPSFIQ